jgi:hypothetical protein
MEAQSEKTEHKPQQDEAPRLIKEKNAMKTPIQNFFITLALFAGTYSAAAQTSFVLATNYPVSSPYDVTAADVNGDDKMDLIIVNEYDDYSLSTLTVMTNNGSGGFAVSATLAVGVRPSQVVAADVNGDGKVDLICCNNRSSTLTIYTNDGSGGFMLSSTPSVGLHPICVVAADVNGDGKVDLISANVDAATLTVLTNDGSGGFVISSTPDIGLHCTWLVAADVNGDGKVDLIGAYGYDNYVNVWTNNGSGAFALSSTIAAVNVGDFTTADVNGDGKVDLILNELNNNDLVIYTNDGSGGFTSSSTNSVGGFPNYVVAADVNGDGKVDLICANWNNGSTGSLSVLTNNGCGGFVTAATLDSGFAPLSVVTADVNGDGKPDLISANFYANTVTMWLNTSVNPAPPLGITMVSSLPVVVWPAAATNFVLQMTTNLASGNWVTVTNGVPFIGLQITNAPGTAFFRLH